MSEEENQTIVDETKVFTLAMIHWNYLLQHPGWWADMNDPGLKVGDEFIFKFANDSIPEIRAVCTKVEPPTAGEVRTLDKDRSGWYIIHYETDDERFQ